MDVTDIDIHDKIIRSATFEGMADNNGNPTDEYKNLYKNLAENGVRHIITGFMFISNEGRAMHKNQAGMDNPDKVEKYKEVTEAVHKYGSKIYAQLAHTGRQTTGTGYEIIGVSDKKSLYFNEIPRTLKTEEIYKIAEQFANSSLYAKQSGFDGIQLHAAHGYLIHQFLIKTINNRTDEFGKPMRFLELVIKKIREKCGDFPIWIKASGGVDIGGYDFPGLIKFLDYMRADLIEISYGTMDFPLNIFRGKILFKSVLKHNPLITNKTWIKILRMFFKRKKFTPIYNLKYAALAKSITDIPISIIGGFRTTDEIKNCLINYDYVSMCRPFIKKPDLLKKDNFKSSCTNCNLCAVMVDSKNNKLRCYSGNKNNRRKSD